MKLNELQIYDNSSPRAGMSDFLGIRGEITVTDADGLSRSPQKGDILEGTVTSVAKSTTIEFEKLNKKELSFDKNSVKSAYVGQKRRFEVVEASKDKLVLKDLGGLGAEFKARGVVSSQVDMKLPGMLEDFGEANGSSKEDDDEAIKRLSDDDYKELSNEGFSVEKYISERLFRALERIKTNRAAKRQSIEKQAEHIREERENVKLRSAKAASDKYAKHQYIVDALSAADLPITDENVAGILNSVMLSGEAVKMSENSFAYLIGNGLEPTAGNIYKSVYSGSIKRTAITPADWNELASAAQDIIKEASEKADVQIEDAKWFIEYGLPLNPESVVYKKELEELSTVGVDAQTAANAAAEAIAEGKEPADAILIASHKKRNPVGLSAEELNAKLTLAQARLTLASQTSITAEIEGIKIDLEEIRLEIDDIKNQLKSFYEALADEVGAGIVNRAEQIDAAADTEAAVETIAVSPVSLYKATLSIRNTITLKELAASAEVEIAANASLEADGISVNLSNTVTIAAAGKTGSASVDLVLGRYETAHTEIRTDLGDSIKKAFGNVDSLLEDTGLKVTEANRRAVRILGYNSMEITADNIETMKFFDSKVTSVIEGLKPAMVMSMISRGFNPLDHNLDDIKKEIALIESEEGETPEERFSTFLVNLEAKKEISEDVRNAYIGIYRLLYQIEKSDGAVIGAAIASGKELTLKNLLSESRSRLERGMDFRVDDSTASAVSSYVNSITEQIETAFEVTSSEAWEEALGHEEIENLSLEQVAEKLSYADTYSSDESISTAAERLRSTILAAGPVKGFLKSLNIDDSAKNIEAFAYAEEPAALEFADKDELINSVADSNVLADRFDAAEKEAKEKTEAQFLGDIAIISKGVELNEQLGRYGLLNDMAKREHFRMKLEGEVPARINLTVIHGSSQSSTVSLEVSTDAYHVRANLSMTIYEGEGLLPGKERGHIDGRISCDSVGELEALRTPFSSFITAMKTAGFETSGVDLQIDRVSPNMYLSRLGELARRAEEVTASVEQRSERKASTTGLYNMAKEFLANFI